MVLWNKSNINCIANWTLTRNFIKSMAIELIAIANFLLPISICWLTKLFLFDFKCHFSWGIWCVREMKESIYIWINCMWNELWTKNERCLSFYIGAYVCVRLCLCFELFITCYIFWLKDRSFSHITNFLLKQKYQNYARN